MINISKHIPLMERARKEVFLQISNQPMEELASGDLEKTILAMYHINQAIKAFTQLAKQ